MANNSVGFSMWQRPIDPSPLSSPVIRYITSDQIQEFYADATVSNANTAVNIFIGKGNGHETGLYFVGETVATLEGTPLANFIALSEYTLIDGSTPSPAPAIRYVNPVLIQDYYTDTASGVSGANSQVNLQFRKGNGYITKYVLVGQTVVTIKNAIG